MANISKQVYDLYKKDKKLHFPEGVVAKATDYLSSGISFVFEDGSELILDNNNVFWSEAEEYEAENISQPKFKNQD